MKIGNIELGDFPLLLAPMEAVSDPPFRSVCKENGADLMFTEFISSEGLIRNAEKSTQKHKCFASFFACPEIGRARPLPKCQNTRVFATFGGK